MPIFVEASLFFRKRQTEIFCNAFVKFFKCFTWIRFVIIIEMDFFYVGCNFSQENLCVFRWFFRICNYLLTVYLYTRSLKSCYAWKMIGYVCNKNTRFISGIKILEFAENLINDSAFLFWKSCWQCDFWKEPWWNNFVKIILSMLQSPAIRWVRLFLQNSYK